MPGKLVTDAVTTSKSDVVVQEWKSETVAINALFSNCCQKCTNSKDDDEDWRPSLTLDNFAFFHHGQNEALVALDDDDKVSKELEAALEVFTRRSEKKP